MIDKDRVLRLNCPGFGEETHLNMGRAKTLENYQVIIANPVSLLHLFDKGPEPTRRINQLLSEGVNQLNVPDDALIQELINESDARLEELIPFLSQGGLLIYFLCRPFVLAGPTISVDNYDWLSVYAPAMKNPPENGSRQMSSVSHGRIIEPTEEGEGSEMAEYLTQQGVEWNTIIRTDFLSSNYSVMATAGSKKCIAAQFWAGDNGGKVVFLPAPYSPDFDRVLMSCVDKWYQEAIRQGTIQAPAASAAPAAVAEDPAFHKPTGPDFYNGEQVETPPTLSELGTPGVAPAAATSFASSATPPAAQTYAPPPLSSLLKFPGEEAAPAEAKAQPPKGALKSLLSADFDDDDDDFGDLSEVAPPVVKESEPAPKLSPSGALAKAVAQAGMNDAAVDAETPKVVEPEKAQVSNFELKKATAEMDLSQFAQTARQLVEQANVIESATRDPGKEPAKEAAKEAPKPAPAAQSAVPVTAAAAKQRIADILKGLEFGKGSEDSDDLEASARAGEDVVDVEVSQPEKSSNLAAGLKPNRESVSRNWLGGGNQHQEADASELSPLDVAALSPSGAVMPVSEPAAPPPGGLTPGMSTDEFRSTFEFLKSDDSAEDEIPVKSKFAPEDVPEDKRSLMAQAGLSADSLMSELSVMNELNLLMEEADREAAKKAAAETSLEKEDSPLQSLFKGEAIEGDKEEKKLEDDPAKSLAALMQSLEEAAPEAKMADAKTAEDKMAEFKMPENKMPEPATGFDPTKTAESAPSLKLAHEHMNAPATTSAFDDDDDEEFSWAPKLPGVTTSAPAAAAPAATPADPIAAPVATPVTTPAAELAPPPPAPATVAAGSDEFDSDMDLDLDLELSLSPLMKAAAKHDEEAARALETTPPTKEEIVEPVMEAAAPTKEPEPASTSPRDAMAALKGLEGLDDLEDFDFEEEQEAESSGKPHWSSTTSADSLPAVAESAPAFTPELSPPTVASAASAAPAPEPMPASAADPRSIPDPRPIPDPVSNPLSAPVLAPVPDPVAAPIPAAAWAPAAAATPAAPAQPFTPAPAPNPGPAPSHTPTAAEVNSAWAPTAAVHLDTAPAAAAPPPASTPTYQHPAHPTPVQSVIPAPSSPDLPPNAMSTQALPAATPVDPLASPFAPPPAPPTPPLNPLATAPLAPPTASAPIPLSQLPPQNAAAAPEPAEEEISAPDPILAKLDLAPVTPPLTTQTTSSDSLEKLSPLAPATTNGDGDKSGLHTPQPEELIKKMQQLTTNPAPSWCTEFTFPFIEGLRKEHSHLTEQMRQLQNAINGMEARLETVETLKVALLTGEQDAFLSASQEILTRVGWQVQASRTDPSELWLVRGERVEAIARVVRSQGTTNRTELAQLAQSVIAFWDKYETEPKGLLLSQNFSHQHPGERTETDFAQPLVDAAAKKSLCLMSSFQLLAMFKDGEMGQMSADEMRKRILETNGKLAGFALDSTVAQPATV